MKQQVLILVAVVEVAILIVWGISRKSFKGYFQEQVKSRDTTRPKPTRHDFSIECPADHFAIYIRSGFANVIGPTIGFDGKSVMSPVKNNVRHGLNIAVFDGENGSVENTFYTQNSAQLLIFLQSLRPGLIFLAASFDDVTAPLTDEVRKLFVGMGSTLINSVNHRDGWVFAGSTGTRMKSVFEKQSVNDEKTNVYDGWPVSLEVEGCLPRLTADGSSRVTETSAGS
ncbi:protein FAM3C-like [Cynoglossus semilaevis]|uniref:FAM3 metabolism regulating signaling molecule D n=1 Tax=Cynoglossus semilaevis TaxID=244447 RepID=A0A3P8UH94_CYNSE|nr:protein FAM3C-like [Cynoglossus semilaevis]